MSEKKQQIEENFELIHASLMEYHKTYKEFSKMTKNYLYLLHFQSLEAPELLYKQSPSLFAYQTHCLIEIKKDGRIYPLSEIQINEEDKKIVFEVPTHEGNVVFTLDNGTLVQHFNHSNEYAQLYLNASEKIKVSVQSSIAMLNEYQEITNGEYKNVNHFFNTHSALACALTVLILPEEKSKNILEYIVEHEADLLKKIPQKYQYKNNMLEDIEKFMSKQELSFARNRVMNMVSTSYEQFNPFSYLKKLEFKTQLDKNLSEKELQINKTKL